MDRDASLNNKYFLFLKFLVAYFSCVEMQFIHIQLYATATSMQFYQ